MNTPNLHRHREFLQVAVCPSRTRECFLGEYPICSDIKEAAKKHVMNQLSKEATLLMEQGF